MRRLMALLACIALSGCTVAMHGRETLGPGGVGTTTTSSAGLSTSGSNYAVRASFGRPLPPTAPGGHVLVSSGNAAAALLLGIMFVNAVDYLSGGAGSRLSPKSTANRPIAHTCSCYGYRPDQDAHAPDE